MQKTPVSGLYPIIDTSIVPKDKITTVAKAIISGGARILQLRAKELQVRDLMEVSLCVKEVTQRAAVTFIINDRVDVALLTGADGVHLGQEDIPLKDARSLLGPDAIIGVSTHNPEEAIEAALAGADYISLGPLFPTKTKEDAHPVRGLAILRAVAKAVKEAAPGKDIPIVAIGGITEETAPEAIASGAAACAVISDILEANDIGAKVASLIKKTA